MDAVNHLRSNYSTRGGPRRGKDQVIAKLATSQHGVVAHRELETLGVSPSGVKYRIACGRLHRLHVGVYAVGHRVLAANGHRMAAVLACGSDAVLSHRSAAALHGLRPVARTRIDVPCRDRPAAPARGSRSIA
jgi:predicted transcriptional regulator of viral defense system